MTRGVMVVTACIRLQASHETRGQAEIAAPLIRAVEGVLAVDNRLRWKRDDTKIDAELAPTTLRYPADERP